MKPDGTYTRRQARKNPMNSQEFFYEQAYRAAEEAELERKQKEEKNSGKKQAEKAGRTGEKKQAAKIGKPAEKTEPGLVSSVFLPDVCEVSGPARLPCRGFPPFRASF